MKKSLALLLVVLFLTSSLVVIGNPVSGATLQENTWAEKAPIHQARSGLGIAAVTGKIYAIGGTTAIGQYPPDASNGGFVSTNEEYNPKTDTWTNKASMPTPRDYFAIATYQNKIYCIGGAVGFTYDERSGFYGYVLSGVNEVYDPETNTWLTKKPMPYSGSHLQATVADGKIYVLQGFVLHVYDPAANVWQTDISTTPFHPQGSSALAAVDNKIVVTGVYETGIGLSMQEEQKVLIYNIATNSWSEGKTGPILVSGGAIQTTTSVNAFERVYVLGMTGYPSQATNQVYDPQTNAWMTANAMPTLRLDFGVAIVDDMLYAIGGYSYTSQIYGMVTPVAVNEQYTPLGYGVQPEINVLSPLNQVLNESNVPLIFTMDKAANWTGYSLDGEENVTVVGNTTLTDLPNGLHNVTLYAEDTFGNIGVSETISFTVEKPEPFPTAPFVAVSIFAVVVIVAGLLVYFKKHKHNLVKKP